MPSEKKELAAVFSYRIDEYLASGIKSDCSDDIKVSEIDLEEELRLVSSFIERPCSCFNNCQKPFTIYWNRGKTSDGYPFTKKTALYCHNSIQ